MYKQKIVKKKKGIKIILIVVLSSSFALMFTRLQSIAQADLYLLCMSMGTSVQQCCSTLSTALENSQKHQVTNPLFEEEYIQTILSENITSYISCFPHLRGWRLSITVSKGKQQIEYLRNIVPRSWHYGSLQVFVTFRIY